MAGERSRLKALRSAEEICRNANARLTRQRRTVFESVLAARQPLTAYEILELVRSHDVTAAPIAVYRSLEFLIKHGLVHRIDSAKAFVACAMPSNAHPCQILVCRSCGTTIEAEDASIAAAATRLGDRFGFALDRRTVELIGVCAACRRRANRPSKRPPKDDNRSG